MFPHLLAVALYRLSSIFAQVFDGTSLNQHLLYIYIYIRKALNMSKIVTEHLAKSPTQILHICNLSCDRQVGTPKKAGGSAKMGK